MQLHTRKIVAGITAAAVLLPAVVSAQASANGTLSAQVQSLLSQIQALQTQLKTLLGSSTPMMRMEKMEDRMENKMEGTSMNAGQLGKIACVALTRNLRVGSRGDDVKKLQEMLGQDPENEFSAEATGFFGPLTANAIAKFQMRMGIASSTDGTVGPLTRGFFERACGKGLSENRNSGTSNNMGIPGMPGVMGAVLGGTITVSSDTSITVQGKEGKVRVVNISSSTAIQVLSSATATWVAGSTTDLTVGKMVRIEGTPQSDGSLNATIIRVGVTQ